MTEVHGRKRVELATATLVTIGIVIAVFGLIFLGSTKSARAGETSPDSTLTVDASTDVSAQTAQLPVTGSLTDIKNVIIVLADDMDSPAFDQVPRLAQLRGQGTSLTNFVVTNSLCCPSRTSFMRGQFVHNHRVVSNIPSTGGGWQKFKARNLQDDCLATWLDDSGVNTSLVGKFLNGFPNGTPTPTYIPPGYDYFATSTSKNQAYVGYDYELNINGVLKEFGSKPADYMNDVLTKLAVDRIKKSDQPFFLEFAPYNPHTPFPASNRHKDAHQDAGIPRTKSFNAQGINELGWIAQQPLLTQKRVDNLDRLWQRRLQSMEDVADSVQAIQQRLRATGHDKDTLLIVTSDNGYHAGVHRLSTGKQTAYHEDSVVPAVFIGPGIPQGQSLDQTTSMTDLAPTIAQLLGAKVPAFVDGRDLMPLFRNTADSPWRTATLTENLSRALPGDPDYSKSASPNYHALRSQKWLYVEYLNGDVELYDLATDPEEMNNVQASTNPVIVAQLRQQLEALRNCKGESCRIADSLPNGSFVIPLPQVTANPTATPSVSNEATPTASTSVIAPVQ